MNSNIDLFEGSPQREWLISKLENLPSDIKFVIAIYHHPTFSTGNHGFEVFDTVTVQSHR